MIPAAEPDRQSRVVYGVVLDDDRTATLVRRIMNLSVAIAILGVISVFVIGVHFWRILIGLAIPGCGYFGAKQRDEGLLTAFWFCNLVGAAFSIWTGIVLFVSWNTPNTYSHDGQNVLLLLAAIVYCMCSGCQIMMCTWGRELAMTPTFVTTTSANPVVATYSEVVTSPDAEYAELK